jgi:hypothetical protein
MTSEHIFKTLQSLYLEKMLSGDKVCECML